LIVWIIGEYCLVGQIIRKVLPTVLQYLACCFTPEELDTKLQILNTTAKVFLGLGIFFPLINSTTFFGYLSLYLMNFGASESGCF